METTQECQVLFWTNPGKSTSQNSTCIAIHLSSHFINHPSKMCKTWWALMETQEQTHKQCFLMDSYTWTHQCWPTSKNYIHQLCVNTGCRFEVLLIAMTNKDGWQEREREREKKERVKGICAVSTLWWSLSFHYLISFIIKHLNRDFFYIIKTGCSFFS